MIRNGRRPTVKDGFISYLRIQLAVLLSQLPIFLVRKITGKEKFDDRALALAPPLKLLWLALSIHQALKEKSLWGLAREHTFYPSSLSGALLLPSQIEDLHERVVRASIKRKKRTD